MRVVACVYMGILCSLKGLWNDVSGFSEGKPSRLEEYTFQYLGLPLESEPMYACS